jgi:general secretion pathway protein J
MTRFIGRGSSRGFTLVELLVAITLFALLSVMLFEGLRFGTRVAARGAAGADWTADLAAAATFLRAQLADARPLTRDVGGGRKAVAFDGESESLEFVTELPAYLARGGWYSLHLGRDREDRGRLVLSWRLVRSDEARAEVSPPHSSVLLNGVKAVELAYFGAANEGEAPQWQEHWRDAELLPSLVRLRISFLDGRSPPDLIVALRAAAPPG